MKIAITVNRSDVWFCRICVASIRYYYPDVPIFLIKDDLKGIFSTAEIEQKWNVQLINLPHTKFGWSAAKIFFYTDERFRGEQFLVIDADIVFSGRVLDTFTATNADIIVSGEITDNPNVEWVTKTYFDIQKVTKLFSEYEFPGYFFNAGQMVIKIGCLPKEDIGFFFDFNKFPFWTQLHNFPLVDQSMLNVLVPIWEKRKQIVVEAGCRYMLWSEEATAKHSITLQQVKEGIEYPVLIHWAGAKRTAEISRMTRSDVLYFFENYYYSKIPLGFLKQKMRKLSAIAQNALFERLRWIKKRLR